MSDGLHITARGLPRDAAQAQAARIAAMLAAVVRGRAALEHRRAGDQHVGAGLDAERCRLGGDAAVDLEPDVAPAAIIARSARILRQLATEEASARRSRG